MSLREAGNMLWRCSRFVVWRLEGVPVVSLQLGAVQNKSNEPRFNYFWRCVLSRKPPQCRNLVSSRLRGCHSFVGRAPQSHLAGRKGHVRHAMAHTVRASCAVTSPQSHVKTTFASGAIVIRSTCPNRRAFPTKAVSTLTIFSRNHRPFSRKTHLHPYVSYHHSHLVGEGEDHPQHPGQHQRVVYSPAPVLLLAWYVDQDATRASNELRRPCESHRQASCSDSKGLHKGVVMLYSIPGSSNRELTGLWICKM